MSNLLDSNGFIQASLFHYRMELCPGYWAWIKKAHAEGLLFSVWRVWLELMQKNDDLAKWVRDELPEEFFIKPDRRVTDEYGAIAQWAYGQTPGAGSGMKGRYKPSAVSEFFRGADPWIVAQAMAHGQTVITQEVSNSSSRTKVKIPDVCDQFSCGCKSPFQLLVDCGVRFSME